jgi:hypothetical protein
MVDSLHDFADHDPALAFFLPQYVGLQEEWKNHDQRRYATYCLEGAKNIALMVREAWQSGAPIDSGLARNVLRSAYQSRREMAFIERDNQPKKWQKYGVPYLVRGTIANISDNVGLHPKLSRFHEFYDVCQHQLGALKNESIEMYGVGFTRQQNLMQNNGLPLSITTRRLVEDPIPIGLTIFSAPSDEQPVFTFNHSLTEEAARLTQCLAEDLDYLGKQLEPGHEEAFWGRLGVMALTRFQGNNALLGGQTINLMLIAGVMLAAGYELVPMRPSVTIEEQAPPRMVDHWLYAEISPIEDYVQSFATQRLFASPPPRRMLPIELAPLPAPEWEDIYPSDASIAEKLTIWMHGIKSGNIALSVKDFTLIDLADGTQTLKPELAFTDFTTTKYVDQLSRELQDIIHFYGLDTFLTEINSSRQQLEAELEVKAGAARDLPPVSGLESLRSDTEELSKSGHDTPGI